MTAEPFHLETNVRRKRVHLERLAWLPVVVALAGVWALGISMTLSERTFTLERVTGQLNLAVMTLADFNELAEMAAVDPGVDAAGQRTAAIWRTLLQYPTASIWVESDGVITGGQEPLGNPGDVIRVEDVRERFTVHAALPVKDALAEWQASARDRMLLLAIATVAFVLLSGFLIRALRQRTRVEQELVEQQARTRALSDYQVRLEETVQERTRDLRDATVALESELHERKAAEARLKEHDALLNAVTRGAAELLGSRSLEEGADAVLEMIGKTVGVSRVHLNRISTGSDGHLRASVAHEWCATDMIPVAHKPQARDMDLSAALPHHMGTLLAGRLAAYGVDEMEGELREFFASTAMRSCLQIPVMVDGKLWGSLVFADSAAARRQWSWAETDTLQTLAGLFGEAVAKASYVKELADANMIVQNSPTILYRLRGTPPFPLIYVSHNIRKFGHEPDVLVDAPDWIRLIMDPEDESKVAAAMARTFEKDTTSASIEFRLRTGDGDYRWVENRYTPVRDAQGRLVEIEGMIIDITERKAAEEKISQLARTDALTGLANRGTFIEQLRQAFAAARRGGNPFAIMYLDLDHFKAINDTLGHQVGDGLLREVANRLKASTRANDVVARLGGDEFAILQADVGEAASAGALAASILAAVTRPYQIDGNELHVSTSIGICPWTAASTDPDAMLAQADLALYRSKEEGRNQYHFHSDDLDQEVVERMALADELRLALDRDELDVHYQPQVELASGRIVGMEALARWNHPERGLLPASVFVPVAEKTGTIVALGEWLLDRGCRQIRQWRDEGLDTGALTINLSFTQLKAGRELVKEVRSCLERYRLSAGDLSFDVTEATLARLTLAHSDVLVRLRELGTRIAIADFGSEYSSLDYLRTYRVNQLKITQEFINAAAGDEDRAATMRAIIGLAHELNIDVITQGVETAEQRDRLADTATYAQGSFFSEAVDATEATGVLYAGRIDPAGPGAGGGKRPSPPEKEQSALPTGRRRGH